jgi:hypothetical protein
MNESKISDELASELLDANESGASYRQLETLHPGISKSAIQRAIARERTRREAAQADAEAIARARTAERVAARAAQPTRERPRGKVATSSLSDHLDRADARLDLSQSRTRERGLTPAYFKRAGQYALGLQAGDREWADYTRTRTPDELRAHGIDLDAAARGWPTA